jgi:hypothetical protein
VTDLFSLKNDIRRTLPQLSVMSPEFCANSRSGLRGKRLTENRSPLLPLPKRIDQYEEDRGENRGKTRNYRASAARPTGPGNEQILSCFDFKGYFSGFSRLSISRSTSKAGQYK